MIWNFWLILIGLSLVSMCIQVAQAKVEKLVQETLAKHYKTLQQAQMTSLEELKELPQEASWDDLQEEPEWFRSFVGAATRERIDQTWKRKTQMKVKGVQTEVTFADSFAQTEPLPDWTLVILEKQQEISDLVARMKDLETQNDFRNENAKSHGDFPSSSSSRRTTELASVHRTFRPRRGNVSVPYREVPFRRNALHLDYGRELISELTWRLQECRSLVSARHSSGE